jgi:hypothetical protein
VDPHSEKYAIFAGEILSLRSSRLGSNIVELSDIKKRIRNKKSRYCGIKSVEKLQPKYPAFYRGKTKRKNKRKLAA